MDNIVRKIRGKAVKHVLIQAIPVIMISALLLIYSRQIAFSFLLGGMVCVLPNLYFARRFCLRTGAQNPRALLNDLYRAEIGKLILTAFTFWLIFSCIPVTIAPVFIGFITAQVAFWVSLLLLRY
ncbi:MAG: ATP synthase subunit I [Coxiellaceae bacterium]|nr:ATP synthase subunit I [Coxiellaceae bacterium]